MIMANSMNKRLSSIESVAKKSRASVRKEFVILYEDEPMEPKIQERLNQLREKYPEITADDLVVFRIIYDGDAR